MKYLISIFWSVILGFVASYVGSALMAKQMDIKQTVFVMIIFGIILNFLPMILKRFSE